MVRQIFELWKSERKQKGTTLHRRLVLFFVLVSVSLILAFTLMMTLFGITGKGEKALHEDIDSLIAEISAATGEKTCPHCGESVAAEAVYCSKCGAKMDAEPVTEPAPAAPAQEALPESKPEE